MPEPQGAALAMEAYHRGATLSSRPFVRTQSTHLSPVLGGSKGPHWAWHLPVYLLLGQTIRFQKSLKDLRHEKRGSQVRARAEFALASVTPTCSVTPSTCSCSSGIRQPPKMRLGLQSGNYPTKLVNIPPGPLPLPTTRS